MMPDRPIAARPASGRHGTSGSTSRSFAYDAVLDAVVVRSEHVVEAADARSLSARPTRQLYPTGFAVSTVLSA